MANTAAKTVREVELGLKEATGVAIVADNVKELLTHQGAEKAIDVGAEKSIESLEKTLEGHGLEHLAHGKEALSAKGGAVSAKGGVAAKSAAVTTKTAAVTTKVTAVAAKTTAVAAKSAVVAAKSGAAIAAKGAVVAAKTTAVANVGAAGFLKTLEGIALKSLEAVIHYLPAIGAAIIASTYAFKVFKFVNDATFTYRYNPATGKITLQRLGAREIFNRKRERWNKWSNENNATDEQIASFIDSHMFSNNDAEVEHYGETGTPAKDAIPDVSLDIHFESL